MNKFYVLLLLCLIYFKSNSQWVTIPDSNFANWLNQNFPSCMNGNQMDTTCSAIVNATSVACNNKNIYDLTGIQYFDNLKFLNCKANYLSTLPDLPNTLDTLDCSTNDLISLSSLPPNLKYLDCKINVVLTSLPSLPSTLTYINCSNNQLTALPTLPNSLIILYCQLNQLASLPSLPNSLELLFCENNQLTSLPTLPSSLEWLNCQYNQLSSLPTLPNSLWNILCNYNQIQNLPTLPPSLTQLSCQFNLLTQLPALPANLEKLYCDHNQITELPTLPQSLTLLECGYNQLTWLPELPLTVNILKVNGNVNLSCLPYLHQLAYLNITNTNIQCIPNYVYISQSFPNISSLPVCDLFNNYGCEVYWNIKGKVYQDDNNNCNHDSTEMTFPFIMLNLYKGGTLTQQIFSAPDGNFYFNADTGTYTYTVDTTNLPFVVTCPPSLYHTSVLTPIDSMDYNMDFALQCKPGFDVGVKSVTRTSGQFFPNNIAHITIGAGDIVGFYGWSCNSNINGTVTININGPISYISSFPGALIPAVNGNILTYNISDFSQVNFYSDFKFFIQTDSTAQTGDLICFDVIVDPLIGDNDTTNNTLQHCFTVVNSFDPNAKEVYPEGDITSNQEWMTYTIHFQNTGNAPAQHIFILDTLNNNLIPSSFTLLSFSHEPLTQIFGNVVKFNFPNINLPDSTNDEPNSHGFVQYKVRMIQGLPVGTVISNTAYNYFDFNAPVATNTVSNMVGLTSISNNFGKIDFSIFPNPTKDELNISFNLNSSSEIKIEIYNSLGQVVKSVSKAKHEAGKNLINFSIADLTKGIYNLKFSAGEDVIVKRIVKL